MSSIRRRRKKYRAIVGERTIDLEIGDTDVVIDGISRTFTTTPFDHSRHSLIMDGRSLSAVVTKASEGCFVVLLEGCEFDVTLKDEKDLLLERFGLASAAETGLMEIRAPMPGLVLSLSVERGQVVESGDGLVVLEAMKMENELRAAAPGVVKSIYVNRGDAVGKNDLLVEIEA